MSEAVPVKTLLITVLNSVIEVFLLCMAGYVLARAGVTDKATQRKLNVINVSLFTPALLFSKVAFSLTPAKLREMWIIPLGFVVVSGLSAAVAWVLAKLFKLKKSQTAFAICAAMFQNSNSLPIALIQSLVIEVPHLKWGDDDTRDQMLGRALTYLVLYSTLGMMLRWSWGVKLLSQADDEVPEIDPATALHDEPYSDADNLANGHGDHVQSPEAIMPHPGARETDPFFTQPRHMSQDEEDEQRNPTGSMDLARENSKRGSSPVPSIPWTAPGSAHSMRPPVLKRDSQATAGTGRGSLSGALLRRESAQSSFGGARKKPSRTESGREFLGLPQFPRRERIMLPEEDSSGDEEEPDDEWGGISPPLSLRRRTVSTSRFKAGMRKLGLRLKSTAKKINAFMTVPMYAALLSIFIAVIPPLQAFLDKLEPFERAIRSAGACSIPVTLVVLGAFFYSPPQPPAPSGALQLPDDHPDSPSNNSSTTVGGYFERKLRALKPKSDGYPGENRTVFVAVLSRMIITPLLLLPFIALIARYDLFEAAEDPVFILSAVLLVSSPPALTLAQITQAASGDAFERLISKTISWSYAVLTPPLTLIYVVIGLVFGRL